MDITVNHILYFITIFAIFAYLLKINRAIYYFIMSCMTVVFYLVSRELTMSICISGVLTALIYVFLDRQPLKKRKSMLLMEHMTEQSKEDGKDYKKDLEEVDNKYVAEVDNNDDDFEPKNENKVDHKNSYLELFKSLKPDEINSLNTDTQELIKTQKQLIETLQSMGPALKEGKTILDTFKNYFNDGGLDKLSL
jgi:hypothetical protein